MATQEIVEDWAMSVEHSKTLIQIKACKLLAVTFVVIVILLVYSYRRYYKFLSFYYDLMQEQHWVELKDIAASELKEYKDLADVWGGPLKPEAGKK